MIPRIGVSVGVLRGSSVLLIKRVNPPYAGLWSFPGGALQLGETLVEAARRELHEETELLARTLVFDHIRDVIVRSEVGDVEVHYVLAVFIATDVSGQAKAGSDAAEVRWMEMTEIAKLPVTPGLQDVIEKISERISGMDTLQ